MNLKHKYRTVIDVIVNKSAQGYKGKYIKYVISIFKLLYFSNLNHHRFKVHLIIL